MKDVVVLGSMSMRTQVPSPSEALLMERVVKRVWAWTRVRGRKKVRRMEDFIFEVRWLVGGGRVLVSCGGGEGICELSR